MDHLLKNTNQPALGISVLFLGIIGLTSCANDATVKERTPKYHSLNSMTATVNHGAMNATSTGQKILRAMHLARVSPLVALGENIQASQEALALLKKDSGNAAALHDYNFAVARIVGIIRDTELDPWTHPLTVPSPSGGTYLLEHKPDPRPMWNPNLYNFTPADQFMIGGKYVEEHVSRVGIGAPVVAVGKWDNKEWRKNYFTKKVYYGVTAVARFQGNRCIIAFEDPLAQETTSVNGKKMDLAADFTVPLAVMLTSTTHKIPKLERLLNPEKWAETAQLSRLEPYNPNKAVVLVIHGLMDSPSTWAPMIINLRSDPEIRKHYQFWFYSYPSGYPYPYSASILRENLDGVEKSFPLHKPMVVIGHSMGGCISRLLITDTGDTLWKRLFNHSPADTRLPASSKKLYTDSVIFKHRPEIGRVVFISSPLKGSEMASLSIGRIGSMLVRTPRKLLLAGNDALKVVTFHANDLKLKRAPNSIDTLSPKNRFVRMINTIPIVPGIPYHTIIGDRGRGDSPNSSDGVVPYWSSHMDGAQSEYIVPSDHGAHQNPMAFEEVKRILKQNAAG
jgi:pimeloyl-ACP methyl ester carboxylesterase